MYENIETGESKFSSNESGKIRAFFFRYSFQMITFLPFFLSESQQMKRTINITGKIIIISHTLTHARAYSILAWHAIKINFA